MRHWDDIRAVVAEEVRAIRTAKVREHDDLRRLKLLTDIAKAIPDPDQDGAPVEQDPLENLSDEELEEIAGD